MNNYLQAARVLDGVLSCKGSIKTLALRSEINNKRFVTALVSETLRHKHALDQVLDRSRLQATLRKAVRDGNLLLLLLYDLLYGKGIQGGGQVKRLLLAHEPALRAAAEGVETPPPQTPRTEGGGGDGDGGNGRSFPRYARVNPLKLTVAGAVAALVGEKGKKGGAVEKGPATVVVVAREDIQEDPHIPGLLALPPGTDLHAHPLVLSGALVLQDKASCFSAQALLGDVLLAASAAGKGGKGGKGGKAKPISVCGDVIDACAAPGNKASHVAALLHSIANAGTSKQQQRKSKAKVFALDRDAQRLAVLRRRVGDGDKGGMGYGPSLVVPLNQDFLQLDPADARMGKVRAILLDPSCSGSGMVASLERQFDGSRQAKPGQPKKGDGPPGAEAGRNWRAGVKDGGPTARLKALAQFQYKALTKAFSFPQVERVVYSTCSLHAEEDEMVVAAALRSEMDRAAADKAYRPFELRAAMPDWPRRGLSETPDGRPTGLNEAEAACVVRTDPREDRTNGFFVARFERLGGGSVLLAGGGVVGGVAANKEKEKGKGRKRPREEDEEEEVVVQGAEEENGGGGDEGPEGGEPEAEAGVDGEGDSGGGGPTRAQRRRERRKKMKQQLQEKKAEG